MSFLASSKPLWLKTLGIFLGILGLISLVSLTLQSPVVAEEQSCDPLGWFPAEFGLKDHSVFYFDGYYYLIANYIPNEKFFAYARSVDFCEWEDLTPVLDVRSSEWDSLAVWAPHVFYEDGIYYMYYTGVKGPYPALTQSLMLATSTNPADPDSWEQQGLILQPDHEGMIWADGTWADCRDPMVLKVADTYYLYYTGRDEAGGIVGLATASDLAGPWHDWGATLVSTDNERLPESPTVYVYEGFYYLFYNLGGEYFHIGASPNGPWSTAYRFSPGWAHEVWQGQDAQTYTSYLTSYTVTISPVVWDDRLTPPRPFIGTDLFHNFLPVQIQE